MSPLLADLWCILIASESVDLRPDNGLNVRSPWPFFIVIEKSELRHFPNSNQELWTSCANAALIPLICSVLCLWKFTVLECIITQWKKHWFMEGCRPISTVPWRPWTCIAFMLCICKTGVGGAREVQRTFLRVLLSVFVSDTLLKLRLWGVMPTVHVNSDHWACVIIRKYNSPFETQWTSEMGHQESERSCFSSLMM